MCVHDVSPLADDLSVGLHQVVRDVSSRQVLQCVCGTQLHLNTHTHYFSVLMEPQRPCDHSTAVSAVSDAIHALTSGGGRPPAPAGQSGSIFFLPS